MQRAIVHNIQRDFHTILNGLLADGWAIVPGSFYATTMMMMPNDKTPTDQIDPAGFHHRPVYMAVVQKITP